MSDRMAGAKIPFEVWPPLPNHFTTTFPLDDTACESFNLPIPFNHIIGRGNCFSTDSAFLWCHHDDEDDDADGAGRCNEDDGGRGVVGPTLLMMDMAQRVVVFIVSWTGHWVMHNA